MALKKKKKKARHYCPAALEWWLEWCAGEYEDVGSTPGGG